MITRRKAATLPSLLLLLLCSLSVPAAASVVPVLGKDYVQIHDGAEIQRGDVRLFYIVGCSVCKVLDDVFKREIVFSSSAALYEFVPYLPRLNGDLSRKFTPTARMYLTGQSLRLSSDALEKIWNLARDPKSRRTFSVVDEAAKFLASIGVQEEDAQRTLTSFEIEKKLSRASTLTHDLAMSTENYGSKETLPYISGVKSLTDGSAVAKELLFEGGNLPKVIVNGKYKVSIDMAGGTENIGDSAEKLLQTVFYLLNRL